VTTDDDDVIAWARAHGAAFDTEPLIEMKGAQRIQVGFTLTLYARVPMEKAQGTERREESLRILERLRAIVESLEPEAGSRARVEIEPTRPAAVVRPESGLTPEVSLRARIFHGDDYFAPVTADEGRRMSRVDRELEAKGLLMRPRY
jgi:hypothetical protein